jgi:hypothetical protein
MASDKRVSVPGRAVVLEDGRARPWADSVGVSPAWSLPGTCMDSALSGSKKESALRIQMRPHGNSPTLSTAVKRRCCCALHGNLHRDCPQNAKRPLQSLMAHSSHFQEAADIEVEAVSLWEADAPLTDSTAGPPPPHQHTTGSSNPHQHLLALPCLASSSVLEL